MTIRGELSKKPNEDSILFPHDPEALTNQIKSSMMSPRQSDASLNQSSVVDLADIIVKRKNNFDSMI